MGMAASQARLLSITARIHDVELQAQQIQSKKLQLATLEDEAYRKYNDALDATTLTFTNNSKDIIPATFDNLCGKSSINNDMTDYYVFRASDTDQLIVPDEVYDAYKKFDGNDPYAFAMSMLGVSTEELARAESTYIQEKYMDDNDIKEPLRDIAKQVAKELGMNDEDAEEYSKEVVDGNGATQIDDLLPTDREHPSYKSVKNLVDKFHEQEKSFRYKLYQHGGGEHIYKNAMGKDAEFNNSEFQYYLRWAMLIEEEVGIENCLKESDYGDDFGTNREMLNNMMQSGRITVDTVEIDKSTGGIKDNATSVGADSRLAYTNTSTIDKREVAKAEAEYEHTMKQIDRKDKRYDMDLNKLETERTALTTEYDSVKKVIQENVERTFKIFS